MNKVALVVGATGTAGNGVVDHLLSTEEWEVIAISRNIKTSNQKNLKTIQINLLDAKDLEEKLKGIPVTHLYYTAMERDYAFKALKIGLSVKLMKFFLLLARFFLPLINILIKLGLKDLYFNSIDFMSGSADPDNTNFKMLQNIINVLEKNNPSLKSVSLVSGGKYYGVHLGPNLNPQWKTPFEENDPRYHEGGRNYYYKMEDFLQNKAKVKNWNWTIIRPNFIIGFSENAPYNLGLTMAIYAFILKELNMPLIFPGDLKTFNASWEICSAKGLGRIFEWGIEKNEVFNYTSGRPFKWKDIWPKLGKYFEMEIEIRENGFSVINFFKKNGSSWEKVVKKHNLKCYKVHELVNPSFFENSMVLDWDVIYSMEKAKKFGFIEEEEPSQIFFDLFNNLKERNIIPKSNK